MKNKTRYNLLPCPFCGGRAILERSHRAFINSETTRVAFVRCSQCNARSGRIKLSDFGASSHSSLAEQTVIDNWNARVRT